VASARAVVCCHWLVVMRGASVGLRILLGLVRSLAASLGRDGIRVNAVCPGPTKTPMFAAV
jgi:enoyl-[acyl-carrier-protein] reductase (NADH)